MGANRDRNLSLMHWESSVSSETGAQVAMACAGGKSTMGERQEGSGAGA